MDFESIANFFNKARLLRILVFLATAAIIVFFLPRTDKQSLNYQLHKPWSYALLTAPFDIPIELDSTRIHSIKDSINANFEYLYELSPTPKQNNIPALEKELKNYPEINYRVRTAVLSAAMDIYDYGIVSNNLAHKIEDGDVTSIKMRRGKQIVSVSVVGMRSERQAYDVLDSILVAAGNESTYNQMHLNRFIDANVQVDSVGSAQKLEQLYLNNLTPRGMVQQGEKIVDRGDIVTPKIFSILVTYERMLEERHLNNDKTREMISRGGSAGLVLLLLFALLMFMSYFRSRMYGDFRNVCFVFAMVALSTSLLSVLLKYWPNIVYIMPFALLPLVITTFLDSRVAFFTHVVIILISSIIVPDPLEFVILQFVGGIIGIVSIQELTSRSQLMRSAFYIYLVYVCAFTFYNMRNLGSFDFMSMRVVYGYLAINTVMLSFSYILIFLIEKVFGYVSTLTLVEISDINNPVLRDLSDKCPGTFHHSLQVANLAAEAAHAIHANVQLVRAGAMYHDIGKIDNPAFFTENQRDVNPHNAIDPEMSARLIIEHVEHGVARAEKEKLPPVICDFIREHHGCSKAKFFYTTACNNAPEGVTVDPEPFTYKGPNPRSKETAILMMADSIEAASKSLSEHTEESITKLVNRIIDTQIADGLMSDAPISFRDVEAIKRVLIQRLCSFYHTRIAYPEAKK